ncbi:B12-binding domain-containing radical SAM protein [Paraliomyxa miuraensis]|uniref:B12-binding domain-containing radical SAM protein n=1 Tax=Paraliomyxa miuraensis TaxID=376150 RepID=UPI00225A92EE|nr:radical SAM protein [Paraliomyxa miuraensis]MCX4239469.1 radical SAM protein [Paraliomyxa miuraensis]
MTATAPGVLLISPGIIKWTDMDFGLPHLVSMGGYLRRELGVRVELLDLNYEGGDHHHLRRTIEQLGPHLVIGLSCYSSFDYMRVMALARFIKRCFPDVPLVSGGYHASALPDDVVFDGSPFDAVVVGEGERPMLEVVRTLLGGQPLDRRIYGPDQIEDLDTLPPYAWDLLQRYWPRARDIGRKFQIYLARGCPYHCTFCMERAKSGYKWRAYSSERAIDELRRLSRVTDLSHWVINIADPLFGFRRRWRREVLAGIIEHRLFPRQYWTLTRSDDLDEEDVSLLARARFSIGIGLESGSPQMLTLMQKGNKTDAYLEAIGRLARLSRDHGLNWATNVIVGHPGETMASMKQTREFLGVLFTSAKETCGWLSIDPFRLYPGAQVHEAMETYGKLHGTRFYHPQWWKSWYDGSFMAEHLDASTEVTFETRVRFMYEAYGPLMQEIQRRFRGQGRSVDRVFARSLYEQARMMSPQMRDLLLQRAARAKARLAARGSEQAAPVLDVPIGLQIKDPWVRSREQAVRRLLHDGVLRTADLMEALLQVAPERFMSEDDARAVLGERRFDERAEGELWPSLEMRVIAIGLEALEPALRDRVAVLGERSGYLSAVLSQLVGERGHVLAMRYEVQGEGAGLEGLGNVEARAIDPRRPLLLEGAFDGVWIGAAIPRVPRGLVENLNEGGGRAIAFVGPRFRPQDLVSLTRHDDELVERRVARLRVPVLVGAGGWLRTPPVGPARAAE